MTETLGGRCLTLYEAQWVGLLQGFGAGEFSGAVLGLNAKGGVKHQQFFVLFCAEPAPKRFH